MNSCYSYRSRRISNPLHYRSANSPMRKGQDSNLQPQWGDGFQDRSTAVVHPSYLNAFMYSYINGISSLRWGSGAISISGHLGFTPFGGFPVIIILLSLLAQNLLYQELRLQLFWDLYYDMICTQFCIQIHLYKMHLIEQKMKFFYCN